MKILVCGDRNWVDCSLIRYIIWRQHEKTVEDQVEIVEGEAEGADKCGRLAAEEFGFNCLKYPADWKKYGKAAGPIRNQQMLDENPDLDAVLAFHDSIWESKGTLDMVKRARKIENLPVAIISHSQNINRVYSVLWFSTQTKGIAI